MVTMSMRLEQERTPPAAGQNDAGHDEASESIFNFVIDGHRFMAVRSGRLEAERQTTALSQKDRQLFGNDVVGNIHTDRCDYVVTESDGNPADEPPSAVACLTSREIQISYLIAEGKCDKEIARQLGISMYTVREHLRRIFSKLNVCRRSAVVSWILRRHDVPV